MYNNEQELIKAIRTQWISKIEVDAIETQGDNAGLARCSVTIGGKTHLSWG